MIGLFVEEDRGMELIGNEKYKTSGGWFPCYVKHYLWSKIAGVVRARGLSPF
jgi:hypothetical protein